jgi:hypothetical protein
MTTKVIPEPPWQAPTPLLIYQTADGRMRIAAQVQADTLWLMHQQMAQLFQTPQQNISLHLQNVFDEGKLQPEASHKDFLSVRQEGSRQVSRQTRHYKLDAVLSVGYRVKSTVATRFRMWATQQLREYMSKGFTTWRWPIPRCNTSNSTWNVRMRRTLWKATLTGRWRPCLWPAIQAFATKLPNKKPNTPRKK